MVKVSLLKAVAVALLTLFVVYARRAHAGEVVSNGVLFASGTSFEKLAIGAFDAMRSDEGDAAGPYHWYAPDTNGVGSVTGYAAGAAYDYAAHGLVRNSFLAGAEPGQSNYLRLTSETELHRSIFSRQGFGDSFSNVAVRAGSRESIYCDLLIRFSGTDESPILSPSVLGCSPRIIVWARVAEDEEGAVTTNFMATAGYWEVTNTLQFAVSARDYVLETEIDFSRWYRLTIRAHGDIAASGNSGLSGFSIYLDGKPLRAAGYAICPSASQRRIRGLMSPEARALANDRRLFPCLATPGQNAALTLSGFSFFGDGCVDDVSFSSEDPGYGRPEAVWTLNWGAGVTKLEYTVDGGLTTNAVAAGDARSADILLGNAATNGLILKVTACDCDSEAGYKPGVWLGRNGVTVTNGTEFVFDGSTRNPVATVATTREQLTFGGKGDSGYDTFLSAFAALDRSTNEVKTLCLNADAVVSSGADAYGNNDFGYVNVTNACGEYVLDLNGHTLQGTSAQHPTLVVGCKSLRIIDSSEPDSATKLKKGRILPVESHTNEDARLNTAVQIYPRTAGGTFVEPVVTLEDGIYDGWVVNQANLDAEVPLAGTLFVEGGRYISTNAETFYLDSSVTNPTLAYVFRDDYWQARAETNLVVWTGLGDGRRWVDPANWKIGRPPTAKEVALFPGRASGPWTVDVGTNRMTTASLALEGDVSLSGTNDFTAVTADSDGRGRLCGDATLVYTNAQPGKLTETLLRDDWAGTVVLRNIGYPKTKAPKVLKDPETWGTASSTVVFNGVRGYVQDVRSHTMPYRFVLEDLVVGAVTNAAWQNDLGYTGSTLAYTGGLSGNGTFLSGYNTYAVYQLFKFSDVRDFCGKFDVRGKRVHLGKPGSVPSATGLLSFGDDVAVRSDCGWTCRQAVFGAALQVRGETNDILVTCTAAEPDVSVCTNLVLNGFTGIAWLAVTNQPKWTVYVSGEKPALDPLVPKKVFLTSDVRAAAAATAQDDDGYSAAALRASLAAANDSSLALAYEAVEQADLSLEVADGTVAVTVKNAARGLWYGLRHRASLNDDWDPPTDWKWFQATGPTVTLSHGAAADAGFYGIVVANEDPAAAQEGGSDD